MLTFSINSANFIGRVFFLLLAFFMIYIFMTLGLRESNNGPVIFSIGTFDFKPLYLLFFIVAVICYLAVTIAASLLSINKVQVDTSINSITFVGLFTKKTIATVDISEYYQTVHSNAFKVWYGLLIKTSDNKTIQVAGQNIKSLSGFKDYLNDRKIFYAGQKKMKFPFN
jgi:hypothetical protein